MAISFDWSVNAAVSHFAVNSEVLALEKAETWVIVQLSLSGHDTSVSTYYNVALPVLSLEAK